MRLRPVWKEVTGYADLCRPELVGLRRYDFDYPNVRARYWQVYEPSFEPDKPQTGRTVVGFQRHPTRFPTSGPPDVGIHLVFVWRLYDAVLEHLNLEWDALMVSIIFARRCAVRADNQYRQGIPRPLTSTPEIG